MMVLVQNPKNYALLKTKKGVMCKAPMEYRDTRFHRLIDRYNSLIDQNIPALIIDDSGKPINIDWEKIKMYYNDGYPKPDRHDIFHDIKKFLHRTCNHNNPEDLRFLFCVEVEKKIKEGQIVPPSILRLYKKYTNKD